MSTIEEIYKDDDKIKEIAEEANLETAEDKEHLEEAFRYMYIDEKFDYNIDVAENTYSNSFSDHFSATIRRIRGTMSKLNPTSADRIYPSHARAVDVQFEKNINMKDVIKIKFTTVGYDRDFTEKYIVRNQKEELSKLYSIANADPDNPTSLIDCEVPIDYIDGDYRIDYPPEEYGIHPYFKYNSRRFLRSHNFVRKSGKMNCLNKKGWGYITLISTIVTILSFIFLGLIPVISLLCMTASFTIMFLKEAF